MYLFLLGRNYDLSRAELSRQCVILEESRSHNLVIADSLDYQNPRDLPKDPNQLFLDRLGGTIRFAEILAEDLDLPTALEYCWKVAEHDRKRKIGFSVFCESPKPVLSQLIKQTKAYAMANDHNWRIENHHGKNLNSGQIFERRLLQKGVEFMLYQRPDRSFVLARTVANQNLRNYDLRDRKKPWRDPKMGMLPPRLAQILINLALAQTPGYPGLSRVTDPFCGSGTVCAEAAIMGLPTQGSDLNPKFIEGARQNFQFLSEKFRFDTTGQEFQASDVRDLNWKAMSGVIATEGWLGENFERRPSRAMIDENAKKVSQLWQQIFTNLKDSDIQALAFCVPAWNFHGQRISISDQVFKFAADNGYQSAKCFDGRDSFVYQRDGAFVGREICVVKKITK